MNIMNGRSVILKMNTRCRVSLALPSLHWTTTNKDTLMGRVREYNIMIISYGDIFPHLHTIVEVLIHRICTFLDLQLKSQNLSCTKKRLVWCSNIIMSHTMQNKEGSLFVVCYCPYFYTLSYRVLWFRTVDSIYAYPILMKFNAKDECH